MSARHAKKVMMQKKDNVKVRSKWQIFFISISSISKPSFSFCAMHWMHFEIYLHVASYFIFIGSICSNTLLLYLHFSDMYSWAVCNLHSTQFLQTMPWWLWTWCRKLWRYCYHDKSITTVDIIILKKYKKHLHDL